MVKELIMNWVLVVLTVLYNGQHQTSYWRFKSKNDCIAAKAAIESVVDASPTGQDKRNQIRATCLIDGTDPD
jgi:hypothetical protein